MGVAQKTSTAEAIQRVFESPNVPDSNAEPANLVDVVDRLARVTAQVADAITPVGGTTAGNRDMAGSLTAAVLEVASGLHEIADSISDLAQAVRDIKS